MDTINKHTPFKDKIYSANLCAEVTLPTKSYDSVADLYLPYQEGKGEIGLCSISGVIVSNVKSDEHYTKVCYLALKMIDICIHKSDYVFPNLEDTAKSRLNAGVGILGLAHLMAKKGLKYDTQDGRDFLHTLAETHMWHLLNASLRLGKELGNAPWMHKTLWPEGYLPLDTYEKRVDELVTVGNFRDWESLRAQIVANKGIRNSVVCCHMPGESSTIGAGTTNGPYPIRELNLVKTNDTSVNYWSAPEGTKLKNRYQLAWNVSTQDMIKVYSIMQKWCDQSISADLYVDLSTGNTVSSTDMINDYLSMVKYGMKTRYYVNSKTGKSISLSSGESALGKVEEQEQERGCASGVCTL